MTRPLNLAVFRLRRRAETMDLAKLLESFVDAGPLGSLLTNPDHQVIFGRRGTGKTHAFRYLQTLVQERGDISFYADLRTVGSPEGLFADDDIGATDRAGAPAC